MLKPEWPIYLVNYIPSGKKNIYSSEKSQKWMCMSNVLFPSLRGLTEV